MNGVLECWHFYPHPSLPTLPLPFEIRGFVGDLSGKYAIVGVAETKVGKRPDACQPIRCISNASKPAWMTPYSKVIRRGRLYHQPTCHRRTPKLHRHQDVQHGAHAARLRHRFGAWRRYADRYGTEARSLAIEAAVAEHQSCACTRASAAPPILRRAIRSQGNEHFKKPLGGVFPPSPSRPLVSAAQRHMHDFGTTSEDLAHVAVATRKHACMNGNATMRKPMTVADHQASLYLQAPCSILNCALESDGGGAVGSITQRRSAPATFRKKP